MFDDLLENGVIQLPEPKRPEDVGRTVDSNYCRYHRMVSHPLEKCVTLKECIMRLIDDGTIILDLDDVVETNHISCQTKGVFLIQFGSLEPFVLHEQRLSNPFMQEGLFTVNVFDKLAVNVASCFEVEEESNERQQNSLGEIDQTLAALQAMLVRLIGGKSLAYPTRSDSIWSHP